jgi:hypothetical protein
MHIWQDNIKTGIKEIWSMDVHWTFLAQARDSKHTFQISKMWDIWLAE